MPDQDGLRFLFDIQDKVTAKLAKIEKAATASAAKIDKAFTRASKSQQTNTAKAIAAEQRRIAAVNKAHAAAIAGLKRESDAFKRSMTRMASAATVAFVAVAGKALDMAGGYDLAMRSVQAKTGATGELMDKLSEQSREMGRTTVHSATEAARGQAFLAQAGFDANEVLSALPGTLNLATAGELGLAEAADIASNVLTGFNLNVSEADRVADVLALTAQSTNTNVQQMGDAMKYAAAVAAAADADFEETAAAIGLLANAGFQGETGGTALRGAMSKLLNPTKAAQQILDKLGVSAVTSTGDLKPLHDIVGQFEDVGITAGDAMKIFGQRAGPGMLALVSQGSDALVDLTGELKNAEGASKKTADIMGGGLWGSIKKLQSIVESAFISFGERLAPAVEKTANMFAKLPGPVQEVVVVVGSLVGAMGLMMVAMPASFGALVTFPGKLIALATSIKLAKVATIAMSIAQKAAAAAQWLVNAAMTANPIGLVIVAIGALVAAWVLWDDEIKAFLAATWVKVKEGFYAFKGWVEGAFNVLKGWLDKIPTPILALMGPVGLVLTVFRKWDDIKQIAKSAYEGIKTWLSDKLGAIFDGIKAKVDAVTGFFSSMYDKIVGNSIVPDMVTLVGSEFSRMGTIMTEETATATADVVENLGDLTEQSIDAASAGNKLNEAQIEIVESAQNATERASGYELALAGMAGQMGGTTGQMLNLVIAMREHNKEQKLAAALGKKTEGSFGKMRMGAAGLATAFSAVGDMVGGTAGKVLTEISGIAKAFATGGLVAGIIAGVMALGKAIWGLFSRGKKKRAAAAKKEAAAAKIVADAAKAAADTHAEAVEGLRLAWLNLPTDQIVLDLTAIREAWDALGVEDHTVAFDDYVASLISARDAGAELTAVELNLITLFEEHQGQRTAMLARHKTEMAGFDTQIAALESLLQTKISEVDALIAQQEVELDALSARQDAEMEALAARRLAALDSIMDVQNAQLELLKEMQSKELAEMQAAQAAQLSALKAARAAQVGVVEAAIQRELDDERIAAQLTIDLRKAGSDQEAIDAAHARAATSTERLLERDELNDLMAEAEERVRARYQSEMDAINAHWDEVEAETANRHRDALTELDETHADQLTAIETAHADELAEHNIYWDDLEELMELRHGVELDNLKAAHTAQLEALLASLTLRRDTLTTSHATELADLDDFHDAKIRAILAAQVAERNARRNAEREAQRPTDNADHQHEDHELWNHDPWHSGDYHEHDDNFGGFRQHGGPVSTGQRYKVGEAGPEMFVPSERGRIEPNGSSGGGASAKDLARAVAESLEGMAINVDGRKLGRLTVRHQPLAVTELGGRR